MTGTVGPVEIYFIVLSCVLLGWGFAATKNPAESGPDTKGARVQNGPVLSNQEDVTAGGEYGEAVSGHHGRT